MVNGSSSWNYPTDELQEKDQIREFSQKTQKKMESVSSRSLEFIIHKKVEQKELDHDI